MLCADCSLDLPRLEAPFCDVCAAPGVVGQCSDCRQAARAAAAAHGKVALSGIRSPYLMAGLARDVVHGFKYRNYRVAAPMLAGLLAEYLEDNPVPGDALAPAPLHRKKLRERGYNQASLLAKELGRLVGLPVEEGLLVRTRNTPAQARSGSAGQRRANMDGAFACRGDAAGMNCILVDDVCTTGSTLRACAEALMEAGAGSVWALTLARERLEMHGIGV